MKTLNFKKEYIVDRPADEVFSELDAIASSSFNNSKYRLFGNFVSVDPPEFLFMAKWFSIGRPLLAQVASTKLLAVVEKEGAKSKIKVTTQTNPALLIAFSLIIIISIIKSLIALHNGQERVQIFIYLLLAVFIIGLDRFLKNIIVSGFEHDLNVR